MEAGEKVRTLSCDHAFHCGGSARCERDIDQWLLTAEVMACPQESLSRAAVEAATAIVASAFTVSIGASATAVAADVGDAGFGLGEGAAASGARRDTSGGVVISIGATASADAVAADLDAGFGGGVAASGGRRNTTGGVVIAVDTRDQAWMGRC